MPTPQIHDPEHRTVLLVIGSLQGGGAERQMADMANYWVAKGWKVVLATWCGREVTDFYPLDARVSRVTLATHGDGGARRSRMRENIARVVRLRTLLKSLRPQAAVSFMTESNVLTILAGVGLKLRVAVSERVQPASHSAFPWTWRVLRRVVYTWADAIVAQTQDAARWLEQNCRAAVIVIPNALRDMPEAAVEREELIVAVGRLTHQKGFDLLLRAFAKIAPGFAGWRLAIVGEGAERENLQRLRDDLLLGKSVEFVGQTPDVVDWMARAGLVVQPSRLEGFPNVVLESMGLGAAVISADCPSGPADLIEDKVNGRLVPVEDMEALARIMAELMSRPGERARLGRAAAGVRQRYRQDSVMDRWEACLFPVRPSEST
jgi:GalNAc-alpha-(1->4)-GalNAc-alpha-(1->3)-diNAcBac-PP-undecaprenol alpha-1,4-N-acetyl-D-galactosaminyltransferase